MSNGLGTIISISMDQKTRFLWSLRKVWDTIKRSKVDYFTLEDIIIDAFIDGPKISLKFQNPNLEKVCSTMDYMLIIHQ